MSLSLVAAASLTTSGGQFIAGYLDGEERGRLFITSAGTPSITNGLPSTVSVTQTSIVDSAGSTKVGGFKVLMLPAAVDTVDSSPMNIYVDQSAWFLVATTANG
jgi:hypothetical protein